MTTPTIPTAPRPATPLLSREEYAEQRRVRCQRHAAITVPPHLLSAVGDLTFRCATMEARSIPLLFGQRIGDAVRSAENCAAHLLSHRGSGELTAEQTAVMRTLALRLQAVADCLVDQVAALNEDRNDRAEGAQP